MNFKVRVEIPSADDEVHLLIDGQTNILLISGAKVEFKKGEKRIKLVRDPRRGFFLALREKFGW
jgi:NAD kinase